MNDIYEGNITLMSLKGIKYLGISNGKYAFKLQSGKYNIQVKGWK
jgi:hypothetical protein